MTVGQRSSFILRRDLFVSVLRFSFFFFIQLPSKTPNKKTKGDFRMSHTILCEERFVVTRKANQSLMK